MMLHQNFKQINMKDFFVAAEFPKTPSPKPARIPPQTPPAGWNTAEVLPNPFPQKNCFGKTESISVFRVFRKMGSDFFKQTPPKHKNQPIGWFLCLGGHCIKKFGLTSSKTPDFARSACVVALT
ncbi:MAG: hypothetical protein Q8R40_05355 [bacterium]|nr:hypothetical protein [bacterium]